MRTLIREVVVKIIYAYLMSGEIDVNLKKNLYAEIKAKKEDIEYGEELLNKVISNIDELLETINSLSKGFDVDRIYMLDKCIMLVAMAEIKYVPSVPNEVSISEAMKLVKIYSNDDKSFSFVNGILAELLRREG